MRTQSKIFKLLFFLNIFFHCIIQSSSKPKFLDSHVKRIEVGWDDTKEKASTRLQLLNNTKDAWVGYGEGLETIAADFEKAEEEIKKIKKRFNLQAAVDDLAKRQKSLLAPRAPSTASTTASTTTLTS